MTGSTQIERLLPDGDEAGTPPHDRPFRPDVQGLRAVAVLLVVLYHAKAPILTGGFVGVDVFFVISGFVITGVLLRERTTTNSTSLTSFYARRARRILPAASLVIVVTVVATYLLQGFLRGDEVAVDGRWAAIFLANFHEIAVGNNYLGAMGTPTPLLHYWSLAVEEQFYLVYPLLFAAIAALASLRRRRGALLAALLVVVVASFAWSVIETSSSPVTAFYSPLTRAWELGMGGVVALLGPQLRRLPSGTAAVVSWLGLAAIGIAAVTISGSTPFPGSAAAIPVLGCAAVIAGGMAAPRAGAELLLGIRPALFVGAISFSLYLWHFPLLVLAQQQQRSPLRATERAVLILAAILLAWLTVTFIENPIRHSKALRASVWRSLVVGLALILATLGICTALIDTHAGGGTTTVPGPSTASWATLQGQIAEASHATAVPTRYTPPLISIPSEVLHGPNIPDRCVAADNNLTTPCLLGDPTATRTMVLLGDSQAMMWSTAFETIAAHDHWRFVILGRDGCPPWLTPNLAGSAGAPCGAFHRYAQAVIERLHPSVVFLTGAESPQLPVAADAAGLKALLARLSGHAGRSALLSPIPWFQGEYKGLSPPECIAEHESSLQACTLSVATLEASYGDFARQMATTATSAGAAVVPVRSLFCTPEVCPVLVAHRVVYQDRVHMTWQYARYVTPALATVLGGVLGALATGS